MSNTSKLYSAMKRYTDTMLAAREEYLGTMAKYETAKGSQFYEEQKQAARAKRIAATESIKVETAREVNAAINAMLAKADTRKLPPLTADQLGILQALKMRDRVGREELMMAGNAMEGNVTGLALIQELAQKNGIPHNFLADAKGIAGETLTKAIRDMGRRCYEAMDSDGSARVNELETPRAAALARAYHERRYGPTKVEDRLPTMAPYADEADFMKRMTSSGISVADFTEAVN